MKKFTAAVAVLAAVPAWVNESKAEDLPLEHVLVTVPVHKSQASTALPVTVLSGDELHKKVASSIGETLNGSPGLASASFGPGVGQPVIRGQSGPRVQVLQNGLRNFDAASLSADHSVAVEPMLADRIEVLRGPATLLYGGGAIGGVVNVVDSRIPSQLPDSLSAALELRHDSASDGNTSVFRGEGAAGAVAWHVSGVDQRWNDVEIPGLAFNDKVLDDVDESSDGFIANSDGELQTGTVGASYHFAGGYAGLAVNRREQEYGIPPGAHEHGGGDEHGDIRIDLEQTRVDGELVLDAPVPALEQLRWRLSYSEYEHGEIEPSGEVGTLFSNDAWTSRLELVHVRAGGWHGAIGLQASQSSFAAVGEESFIPETDTRSLGLFALEDYHGDGWILETGLRVDWDSIDPANSGLRSQSFTSTSGSLALILPLGENWRLGTALSQSRRAPVTEELFSNAGNADTELVEHGATGVIEVGDTELDQEVSNNLDVTLSWEYGVAEGFITAFYNDFRDYIFLEDTEQTNTDGVEIFAYRQRDARFSGVEFEANVQLTGDRDNGVRVALFGDAIDGELKGSDLESNNVPRLPPYRLGIGLGYARGGFDAELRTVHAAEQDDPGAHESVTDSYQRFDASASYRWSAGALEYLLFARGKNLGDEDIRNSSSLLRDVAPEPGRSLEVGLRLQY